MTSGDHALPEHNQPDLIQAGVIIHFIGLVHMHRDANNLCFLYLLRENRAVNNSREKYLAAYMKNNLVCLLKS